MASEREWRFATSRLRARFLENTYEPAVFGVSTTGSSGGYTVISAEMRRAPDTRAVQVSEALKGIGLK